MNDYGKNPPLSYNRYLKVPELLELQETLSEPTSHDELLFIIIHQTYELWFKQILHEIDGAIRWIDDDRFFRANHAMKVVTAIEEVLVNQIHVLETMAPVGFLEFREKLNPASGFQSMQFREVEFISGIKDESLMKHFEQDSLATENVKRRFKESTLADAFWNALSRNGFDVSNESARVRSIVNLLEKPEENGNLYVLQDLLIEHDRNIALWRFHHVVMVERMLGSKRGTGGSAGAAYLLSTVSKRAFPELWQARTELNIP
ncbi:MAG: tryptophan 2,3-dioxygenase [Pyrinomonadaceae bacterium]